MAVDELNFDPKDIAEALRKNVESFTPSVEREEVGRVVEAGDGIARVKGLPGAMANELLEFPGGVIGLAFNLDEDEIGCIILGESAQIEEGDHVKQTGRILSIPVGDGFLGRVIDPLGVPLDGKGPIRAEDTRVLEIQAANVARARVKSRRFASSASILDALRRVEIGRLNAVWGAEDAVASGNFPEREALLRAIRPDLAFVLVPDAGHWVAYEQPEAFLAVLERLLDRP